MGFQGKRIVVTGASRGIGRSLAQQLCGQGATVLGVAMDAGALNQIAGQLGASFEPMPCDLSDRDQRAGLIARLTGDAAPVDALFNNAAIQIEADYMTADSDQSARDIARELAINLEAPTHLATALLRPLAERPEAAIVNVTSALAFAPKQAAPVYCATKAGLQSLTIALRYQAEQQAPNVLVAEAVMPLVDTDMTAGRGRGKISSDVAAAAILRGVQQDQHRIWVGKTRAFGVLHRLMPGVTARMLRG